MHLAELKKPDALDAMMPGLGMSWSELLGGSTSQIFLNIATYAAEWEAVAARWADEGHASEIGPYRRPRLTPNPALAIQGRKFMPFGTPGGDVQTQAMLQTLLNLVVWGKGPQEAVEAASSKKAAAI